jgi:hypothetical protein
MGKQRLMGEPEQDVHSPQCDTVALHAAKTRLNIGGTMPRMPALQAATRLTPAVPQQLFMCEANKQTKQQHVVPTS